MKDSVLSFMMNRFEIQKDCKIYDLVLKSYINYDTIRNVLKTKCGIIKESDFDQYMVHLVMYWTNDVDALFEFYHVNSEVEYIPYYTTI